MVSASYLERGEQSTLGEDMSSLSHTAAGEVMDGSGSYCSYTSLNLLLSLLLRHSLIPVTGL